VVPFLTCCVPTYDSNVTYDSNAYELCITYLHDVRRHQEEHKKLAKLGTGHDTVLPYLKLYILLWHGLGKKCCSNCRFLQVEHPERDYPVCHSDICMPRVVLHTSTMSCKTPCVYLIVEKLSFDETEHQT